MSTTRHARSAPAPARPRRHPEVSPHTLALLHRAQHGDTDAFADLYRTFHEPVTRYVAVRMRERDATRAPMSRSRRSIAGSNPAPGAFPTRVGAAVGSDRGKVRSGAARHCTPEGATT